MNASNGNPASMSTECTHTLGRKDYLAAAVRAAILRLVCKLPRCQYPSWKSHAASTKQVPAEQHVPEITIGVGSTLQQLALHIYCSQMTANWLNSEVKDSPSGAINCLQSSQSLYNDNTLSVIRERERLPEGFECHDQLLAATGLGLTMYVRRVSLTMVVATLRGRKRSGPATCARAPRAAHTKLFALHRSACRCVSALRHSRATIAGTLAAGRVPTERRCTRGDYKRKCGHTPQRVSGSQNVSRYA
ncbi:unnamed protein product [Spodoptera exigua]|nr:unnamed protein product [Spodoptera exigua]